jgi:ABC-type branched-subunit amino acid transport system substrate-binding protein
MIRRGHHLAALATATALLLVACGSDKKTATTTASTPGTTPAAGSSSTPGTGSTATTDTAAASGAWTAPVDKCADPAAAKAPISGDLTIGSAMPLSGSPAVAFAPVKEGFELYLKYANDSKILSGINLKSDIRDDQYDATQTPGVVSTLIDAKVNIFSSIIGTPNNLAVRDTLNEECIPQLQALTGNPAWGADVAKYPWLTGALVPYNIEAQMYATKLKELIGDGGTVGLFYINTEFGKIYADAFKPAAAKLGLKVVEEQTIEGTDENPPANQVGKIAAQAPMAIMAIPLGLQCPAFLKELANAKASHAGWAPKVFVTNTCASKLFVDSLAGAAGDGVYTSGNLLDGADPKNASNPAIKTFLDAYKAAGLKGDIGTTETGWTTAEITVAIIKKAQETGTVSRQSIIEAARNMTYTPAMGRPGMVYKMNGEKDGYPFQTLTILQWNHASATFTEIGDAITSFEN